MTDLWLSGWSVGAEIWQRFVRDLPDRRHVVCDFSSCELPEDHVEVAASALDEVGEARVIGWSLGAMVALELAWRRPAAVQSVSAVAASPRFTEGWDARVLRRMSQGLARDRDRVMADFDSLMFSPAERAEGLDRTWTDTQRPCRQPLTALQAGLTFLADFEARPAELAVPVSLLHGADDAVCPAAAVSRLAAALPDAELTVVDGAGHALPWTRPELIAQWLSA